MFRFTKVACCGLLILALFGNASAVVAQTPDQSLDLSYIPADAVAGAVIHPSRIFSTKEMDTPPVKEFSQFVSENLGIDLLDIEQMTVVVGMPEESAGQNLGVVLHLKRAYRWDDILPDLRAEFKEGESDGVPFMHGSPMDLDVAMLDEQTLLVVTGRIGRRMIAWQDEPGVGKVSELLAEVTDSPDLAVVVDVEAILAKATGLSTIAPVLPELADIRKLPGLVDALQVRMSIATSTKASVVILAVDSQAAPELEQVVGQLIENGRATIMKGIQELAKSDDPGKQRSARMLGPLLNLVLSYIRPVLDGDRLELLRDDLAISRPAVVGFAMGLLLPAVQAARERGRRAVWAENLEQIALAIHNYQTAEEHLPPRAITDEAGRPLLSWRVLLLPYYGESRLFFEFHLDEPWDSPHNIKLVDRMPPVYRSPSIPALQGKTTYQVPVLEDGVIGDSDETTFDDVSDGMSQTILVLDVDADQAVVWTKPEDHPIDSRYSTDGLTGTHPGVFLAIFCDGTVRALSGDILADTFRALLTKSGGEDVSELPSDFMMTK